MEDQGFIEPTEEYKQTYQYLGLIFNLFNVINFFKQKKFFKNFKSKSDESGPIYGEVYLVMVYEVLVAFT